VRTSSRTDPPELLRAKVFELRKPAEEPPCRPAGSDTEANGPHLRRRPPSRSQPELSKWGVAVTVPPLGGSPAQSAM
jgi:hypothetical protein